VACYSIAWMGLPVGLLVGLSRYRLYDANSAISRSVAYVSVTLTLLIVFEGVSALLPLVAGGFINQQFAGLIARWRPSPRRGSSSRCTNGRSSGPIGACAVA
jgi:hypothetical protein